jgi:hypothetical protein
MPATARDVSDSGDILGWIAETPQFKRAARERAAVVVAERAALIRDLQLLETEAAAETPKLLATLDRIAAEKKKIEAVLREVDERLSAAFVAKHNYAVSFARRHDEIEAKLRASGSALIASFVAEMNAEWRRTRREPLTQETAETATKSGATGRTQTYLKTNARLVATRLQKIREVIAGAENLALTEADQSDANIGAKLGELAASLPPMI